MSQNIIDILQFEIRPKINVSVDQVDQDILVTFGGILSCAVCCFTLKLYVCPLGDIKQFIAELPK